MIDIGKWISRQFRRILPSLEQLPQRVAADDSATIEYVTPSFSAYTARRSTKIRLASPCSQPCTRSLICCASACAGSGSDSRCASASNATAPAPSAIVIVLPRYGSCAPSRQSICGSARCSVRVFHSASFAKIQRCFSAIAASMSASVTQRGAVIDKPLPSIVKPIVRRAERFSRYSRTRLSSASVRMRERSGAGAVSGGASGAIGDAGAASGGAGGDTGAEGAAAGPSKSGRSSWR